MAIDKVWVLAEVAEGGGPTPVTLELLTEARSVATTVEAVAWGSDTASLAGTLGEYGATTVYDVGDLGGALPGVPVAAAIAALIAGGDAPDAVLLPATYDGRDVAGRLSVKLDRPVLTNVIGLVESDGALASQHPVFGGSHIVTARFTVGGSRHLRDPGQVLRRRAFRWVGRGRHADLGARPVGHQHGQGGRSPRRGAQRSQARRGRRGGLGWAGPGRSGRTTP